MSITAKKYTYITIIALLTMTLLIVLLPHSVSAKKIYKVGASDLQVREKPSPDGKVLGKLGPDHKLSPLTKNMAGFRLIMMAKQLGLHHNSFMKLKTQTQAAQHLHKKYLKNKRYKSKSVLK